MTKRFLTLSVLAAVAVLGAVFVVRSHLDKPLVVSARAVAPDETISPEALAAIQRMQVVQGPQRAQLAMIEAETEPTRRSQAVERAAQSVGDDDLAKTLGALATIPGAAAAELRFELVNRWAATSPAGAAQWAAQLPDGPVAKGALSQVASAWAETNLDEATRWLETLRSGEQRQTATVSVAYVAAVDQPVSALTLASALPASTERNQLLAYALSQWTSVDSSSAISWAKQIPDAKLREQLLASAAIALSAQDAPAAAAIVGNNLKPGPIQDRAAVSIVQQWAQTSPQAAANWVSLFPDSSLRTAATRSLNAIRDRQLASATGSL